MVASCIAIAAADAARRQITQQQVGAREVSGDRVRRLDEHVVADVRDAVGLGHAGHVDPGELMLDLHPVALGVDHQVVLDDMVVS